MRGELALIAVAAGCARERGPLVDLAAFTFVDAPDDPFEDRPATVDCPPVAVFVEVEPLSLEVDTGLCDYATLMAPLLLDLGPRDVLDLRVGHGVLSANEPAVAHAAVQIGDWRVFDLQEPIPNGDRLYSELRVPAARFPAGTPVWIHVHNHGPNAWNFYLPSSLAPE